MSTEIVIHPSVTQHKYHDGSGDLPYGWTAQCVYDCLRERLPDTGITLAAREDFGRGAFEQANVLLAGAVTRDLLATMPKLAWIQFTGSGADHFFKACGMGPDAFKALGIKVLNCPGISRYPVAEHVMAMLLALGRGIPRAMRQQAQRNWTIFSVDEIRGKTLGIIGLGEIGERVAALGRAFGMHVVGSKRDPDHHLGNAHVVLGADGFDTIVESADYVVLLTPLSESARGRFNYDTFRRMKRRSYFINVSRGENVVEQDLVRALHEKLISGAAVDTFGPIAFDDAKKMEALREDSELWDLPDMLVMPNNAASTEHYMRYFADAVLDNYLRWRGGKPFRSVVA